MIQGHTLLLRIRLAVLTLALTGGMLFSTFYYYKFRGASLSVMGKYLPEVFAEALPYMVAAIYWYVLWGPKRFVLVYLYLRSLVILGLAASWLYLVLNELMHIESGPQMVFGCFVEYKACQVERASQVFGLVGS